MFRRNLQSKTFHNNLFISLTPTQTFNQKILGPHFDIKQLFQQLQTQIQKKQEKKYLRTRPIFYEKLEKSLMQSLKFSKDYNDQIATNQRLMMEKCRNYYHTRTNTSEKKLHSYRQNKKIKNISNDFSKPLFGQKCKSSFIKKQEQQKKVGIKINSLMRRCQKENVQLNQVKKNLQLFNYFNQKSNGKLQRIKQKVQKNQKS